MNAKNRDVPPILVLIVFLLLIPLIYKRSYQAGYNQAMNDIKRDLPALLETEMRADGIECRRVEKK